MFCIVFQQLFGSTVTYALSEWPYWVLCSAVIWKCSDSCAECTNIFCVVFQHSVLVLPAWPTMTCAVCENIQCASAVSWHVRQWLMYQVCEHSQCCVSAKSWWCRKWLACLVYDTFSDSVALQPNDLHTKSVSTVLPQSAGSPDGGLCTMHTNISEHCFYSLLVAHTVTYVPSMWT